MTCTFRPIQKSTASWVVEFRLNLFFLEFVAYLYAQNPVLSWWQNRFVKLSPNVSQFYITVSKPAVCESHNIILLTMSLIVHFEKFSTRDHKRWIYALRCLIVYSQRRLLLFAKGTFWMNKFRVTNNKLCKVFTDHANKELATLLADI